MNSSFNFDLFVSYSWSNKTLVHELCSLLEKKGYKLWLDKNEMKHGNINHLMKKGIDESEIFVCCATTNYCKSENALKEFNYAIARKKLIIYIIFEIFNGEEDRLKKLDEISFEFARQMYYKHDDLDGIVRTVEELKRVKILIKFRF